MNKITIRIIPNYNVSIFLSVPEIHEIPQISIKHITKNNLEGWMELNKYIDQYTKKVRSELAILRDKCPLCDSKNFTFLFDKHGFDHMLCNSCELIFTHQILDLSKIKFLEEGDEGDAYGDYKENFTVNEFDRKKFQIG